MIRAKVQNMNKYKRLQEKSNKLIIVDVQPHDIPKHIHFNMYEFADFVNSYPDVLVLFNGEDLGWESQAEMEYYYEEIGIDISNCTFQEKTYGFFRDWMDSGKDDLLVPTVKTMLKLGKNDVRELDSKILSRLGIDFNVENYPLGMDDRIIEPLKQFKGADICGGGRNECLQEVEYLMDALNCRYKEVSKYIYG